MKHIQYFNSRLVENKGTIWAKKMKLFLLIEQSNRNLNFDKPK